MPRILILYASLGSGHLSAAKALREAFSNYSDVDIQIEDAFEYASPLMRETLTRLYKRLSEQAPELYRVIYEGSDTDDIEESMNGNLTLAQLERPFYKRLEKLVKDSNPDIIICVQQIPSRILQLLDQKGELPQPHYVVITDVIAHSTWINYGVTGYFLPSELTADVLVERGVDRSLLHVTGIPVNLEISQPKHQQEMRRRHDLPIDCPVITLFGGGLHRKRVRMMVTKLLESEFPAMLVVAAGRNQELTDALSDLTDGTQMKLRKLGMIDYVDDLVAASNLVITKSGGLITSEVLARGTPMIIIDPFPGQEEWNADAVAAYGAGIQLRLPEMVPPTVLHLLSQPEQLSFMRDRARLLGRPEAACNIAKRILADWQAQSQPIEVHA
ncbi:MAG: UDP-N-acetylglucosamine--LPS N-acetylglucosamine transferase [Elainellaceae cyanobacterium]